jgi:methylmalonyl-CoA epimerase
VSEYKVKEILEGIMVNKIDHIGIAVKNLEEALNFYENILGLKSAGFEIVEEQKVKVAFLPIGDTEVELLESTEEDGPIARYIAKNGEGVQHIAYRVDDIDEAILLSDRIYIMSGSPGKITDEIIVDEPKPRSRDFLVSESFLKYKKRILDELES